jgi:hypothetical protein
MDKISDKLIRKISLKIETCCSQLLKPLKPREKFSVVQVSRINLEVPIPELKGFTSIQFSYDCKNGCKPPI